MKPHQPYSLVYLGLLVSSTAFWSCSVKAEASAPSLNFQVETELEKSQAYDNGFLSVAESQTLTFETSVTLDSQDLSHFSDWGNVESVREEIPNLLIEEEELAHLELSLPEISGEEVGVNQNETTVKQETDAVKEESQEMPDGETSTTEATEITLEIVVETEMPSTVEEETETPSQETIEAENPAPTDISEEGENEIPTADSEEEDVTEIKPEEEAENQLSPEEIARLEKLTQADELYRSGNIAEAEKLYREVKAPFALEENLLELQRPPAYSEPENLPPAGKVYWRIAGEGLEQNLESKIFVPLGFLVEQYPEFIPGHLRYAQALQDYNREEEALQVLDRAVTLYPSETPLLYAKIEADNKAKRWLEASLVARRFALFNPEHPQAEEFLTLADENLERYQGHLQSELTGNAIANIFTGALGFILTGNIFGPLSALETTMLLLQGETGVGEQISAQVKEQMTLVEDEELLAYVNEIGQKLVAVTGRDDFQYEFNLIMDDRLNAFALPGGKIFINAGAIMETDTEAELAGLLAHEIAHAVLSHGFQLVTQGNLTANVVGNIPYVGGIGTNLIVLDYSRTMEEEADIFGTRMLVASGYTADGVRNLMAILAEDDRPSPPAWLSTHPDTDERVQYLEGFILENQFNRYGYEGVSRHQAMKERVTQLWQEYTETEEYQELEMRRRR